MPRKKYTRAASGSGSIRQRPDGTWEARFSVGRDPGTGKRIRKSVYGKTQAEVRRKMNAAICEVDTGTYSEPTKITVAQWLDLWISNYTGNLKDRTRAMYSGYIDTRIKPSLGAVKLCSLDSPTIQAFYNSLQRPTGENKPLSAKTIKNIHGVLHKALKQAVEIGYIRVNPSESCKLPRTEKPEIAPLTEDQIKAFVQAIHGHPFEALFLTALFTGMRQGELLGLPWENVNFDAGTILIDRQMQIIDHEYKIVSTKSSKPRRIMPATFVMQQLRRQKIKQAEWKLAAGDVWEDSGLVFTNEIGHHLARETVYSNFKTIAKGIGRPDARFHDLRHTYAVSSLRAGDDIKTLQDNLGHYTASFTLDVYGHVVDEMKKASAERMGAFIRTMAL